MMKKILKNMLLGILILLFGIDLFFQNKIQSDIDMEAYNNEYQNLLEDDKIRAHKFYHSFLLFAFYMEFLNSEQAKKNLIGLSGRFEYYVSFQKLSEEEKKKPSVTVQPAWKTSYINFYLLSKQEEKRISEHMSKWRFADPSW